MGKSAPEAAPRVAEQLRKVIAAVVLFNEQVAAQVGMSASESQTLHLLELHGPPSPSELAKLTKLSTGTMTGVLDRLEQLGFVRRERHPVDRRRIRRNARPGAGSALSWGRTTPVRRRTSALC